MMNSAGSGGRWARLSPSGMPDNPHVRAAARIKARRERGWLARLAGSAAAKRLETRLMRVDAFDFTLPEDRIALFPANPRDAARLLHVDGDALADRTVADLPRLLRRGDLLVLNNTKVIPAQLQGRRAGRAAGGEDVAIDVTLVRRLIDDPRRGARWRAFLRPAKRVTTGDVLSFGEDFSARIEERNGGEATLIFSRRGAQFDAALARTGLPPLPPYIARRRAVVAADSADYQTVYAEKDGSVAAPTAGLHFTPALFAQLKAAGVETETITLHVGPGTFLPVTAENAGDHVMHAEWGEISAIEAARLNAAKAAGRRIVAVGTTSLRLLESAADGDGRIRPFARETDIFITPGYRFKTADALLTNFHLPRSTLFMLVCAFAGTARMKRAYAEAIERGYRFYSYGDACLLERDEA